MNEIAVHTHQTVTIAKTLASALVDNAEGEPLGEL
uniref:Uncharacterized protein n=1 Tax=Saccharolobus solfataricus (strain 98/2) TaxID=555311 RepID=D0KPN2_SACS9